MRAYLTKAWPSYIISIPLEKRVMITFLIVSGPHFFDFLIVVFTSISNCETIKLLIEYTPGYLNVRVLKQLR
jgi:hypothetical protein